MALNVEGNACLNNAFSPKVSSVYPFYVQKVERKGRTLAEIDQIISWLTVYSEAELQQQLEQAKGKPTDKILR